jgi:hypothetical protein
MQIRCSQHLIYFYLNNLRNLVRFRPLANIRGAQRTIGFTKNMLRLKRGF